MAGPFWARRWCRARITRTRGIGSATVYVRPHELDIDRSADSPASLPATVLHVHPLGAVVRVQLQALQRRDHALNVELSPERCLELDLKSGDRVFVAPRRARVFVPDYSI